MYTIIILTTTTKKNNISSKIIKKGEKARLIHTHTHIEREEERGYIAKTQKKERNKLHGRIEQLADIISCLLCVYVFRILCLPFVYVCLYLCIRLVGYFILFFSSFEKIINNPKISWHSALELLIQLFVCVCVYWCVYLQIEIESGDKLTLKKKNFFH